MAKDLYLLSREDIDQLAGQLADEYELSANDEEVIRAFFEEVGVWDEETQANLWDNFDWLKALWETEGNLYEWENEEFKEWWIYIGEGYYKNV